LPCPTQTCHPDRSGPTFSSAPLSGASGRGVEGSAFSPFLCDLCVLPSACPERFLRRLTSVLLCLFFSPLFSASLCALGASALSLFFLSAFPELAIRNSSQTHQSPPPPATEIQFTMESANSPPIKTEHPLAAIYEFSFSFKRSSGQSGFPSSRQARNGLLKT